MVGFLRTRARVVVLIGFSPIAGERVPIRPRVRAVPQKGSGTHPHLITISAPALPGGILFLLKLCKRDVAPIELNRYFNDIRVRSFIPSGAPNVFGQAIDYLTFTELIPKKIQIYLNPFSD
jgi:hypothetical protein